MDHTKVQVLISCVDDISDQLASSRVFSNIDLKISYIISESSQRMNKRQYLKCNIDYRSVDYILDQ
jgi:hypothetical protein